MALVKSPCLPLILASALPMAVHAHHAVERFTLGDDGQRLDYEALVTDPETLLEPLTLRWHWDWVPGEALQDYGCTLVE